MSRRMVCVADFEEYANKKLSRVHKEVICTGADQCQTLQENIEAFKRLRIRPRVLRDVSRRDLSTTLLGEKVDFPVGVSSTALQGLAWPDGDICAARAIAQLHTCMIVNMYANNSVEEISAASPGGLKWFQLYIMPDRPFTQRLVRRAELAGYKALVVTVDAPVPGKRYPNLRSRFQRPPHLRIPNFQGIQSSAAPSKDKQNLVCGPYPLDRSLSWKDIDWLSSITNLPIILKGILTAEDAGRALEHPGVKGILVSNHGGRQLDGVPATIEVLPEIVAAVGERLEVYLDGGVRTGTDVLKALALGARAVFVARPAIWGLAYNVVGV
ncbi:2-Hydroxyacid oxidase 1-like isoform X2 [Branchiostoma lanceolatum]|uniref:2-Hydroxyacid oxidase 1-like isoform X2 n=1 Tax=Branchiostoma lanceolatum TaxID=7740 RepID=UPI003453193D